MVLSDSIICFVLLFLSLSVSRAVVSRRSLLRLSVRCRSTQKKSITVHRKILPCSVDFFSFLICAKYYSFLCFMFVCFFPSLHKILEPKNLFCDSNVLQPYL